MIIKRDYWKTHRRDVHMKIFKVGCMVWIFTPIIFALLTWILIIIIASKIFWQ